MILHIPHSSAYLPIGYPKLHQSYIDLYTDWYTDELFTYPGAHREVFTYSRFFADVERLVDDPLDDKGSGLFYTLTPDGQVHYRARLDVEYNYVKGLYDQWHERLRQAARTPLLSGGRSILVDCHSFGAEQLKMDEKSLPDICIGSNEGTTSLELIRRVTGAFESQGLSVRVNYPYSNSIEPIADPGFETIMVEVNKRLYLTEDFKKSSNFGEVRDSISTVLDAISKYESSVSFTDHVNDYRTI